MPQALDTIAPISARMDALHNLGMELPGAASAEEAMKFGRISGWNIRKEPIFAHVGGQQIRVPDRYAVVRDNPLIEGQVDVLGDVGNAYKIIQDDQVARLVNELVADSGAEYATAGAIDGGRKVFVSLRLPGWAKVGGVDKVGNYLTVMTSYDGNSSTVLMVTPVQVHSQSTLNLAFRKASNTYTVRHTSGAAKALHQQAEEALAFTFNYLDGFQEEAEQLVNTSLTQAKFEQLIDLNFGAPKGAAAPTVTRTQNKLDAMAELYSDSFSGSTRGTAWAGLTALAEWYDHYSPVRPAADTTEVQVRSRKALLDPAFKDTALKMMLGLV